MKVVNADKPSRIAKLWKDLSENYAQDPAVDDHSFLDRIDAPEEFRDEYVHLPYDASPNRSTCQW